MNDQESGSLKGLGIYFTLVVVVLVAAAFGIWLSFNNMEERGQFGDMFGFANALFSGFAIGGVVFALILQGKELALQREMLELQSAELVAMKSGTLVARKLLGTQTLIDYYKEKLREARIESGTIPGEEARLRSEITRLSVNLEKLLVEASLLT